MFGIIAESLRTALLDNRNHGYGNWPRHEPGPKWRSELDQEMRRTPHVNYKDLPFRR